MTDIVPELLEKIKKEFDEKISKSKKIKSAMKAIEEGTCDYETAYNYASEVGEILADTLKKNITKDVLPDGKMYYNIANRILNDGLKNNHNIITDTTSKITSSLNKKAKINIKPQAPKLNKSRINGLVEKLADGYDFDKVSWLLGEPVVNFSQNIVDESIKENAEFHHKAGLSSKIERIAVGGCCDYCKSLAGTYTYPDAPKDVYRRHLDCRCLVLYEPKKGKFQNVHSKKWIDKKEVEERISKSKGIKPKRKYKRADNVIEEKLKKRSEKIWETDLLGSEQNALYEYSGAHYGVTNRYVRNSLLQDDDITFTTQRVKELDRALSRNTLGEDLVLYRGVNQEEYKAWLKSDTLDSYKSSSISKYVFNNFGDGHKIIIHAPKKTKGFYLGDYSEFKSEKEFLLHRNQKYRILKEGKGEMEVEIIE